MKHEQKDKMLFVSTVILINSHLCGFIGIISPCRDFFLMLTPLNLLLSTTLLFLNQKEFNKAFFIFSITCFLAGYFIEVIGVKTGLVFGTYTYGNMLGMKLLDVPLVMGLNWLMLVYSVGIICNQLKTNIFFKSILGAMMLVTLDFFIEPVAIRSDFWTWQNIHVPIQNYIAWFTASVLLLLMFHKLKFNKNNKMATALYIVQLVFFILLTIF